MVEYKLKILNYYKNDATKRCLLDEVTAVLVKI